MSFITGQIASLLFEAAMQRIEDARTRRLLLCYSWCFWVALGGEVEAEWLLECIEALEEPIPKTAPP